MNEKYYKAYQAAEEESHGVVRLTEEEHKAVVKFLTQVYGFGGGWCGSCSIDEVPFDTEESAQESLYKEEYPDEDEECE